MLNTVTVEELKALNALKKYRVFTLTAERRLLLGKVLSDLEDGRITLKQAKAKLREKGLLNEKILKALKKAVEEAKT